MYRTYLPHDELAKQRRGRRSDADNWMYPNDFPQGNTTWPGSRQLSLAIWGALPADTRQVLRENVAKLYIPVPTRSSDRLGGPPRLIRAGASFRYSRPSRLVLLPNRVCG
jgi:hypothetical protein